jgi:hypothetical protein
LLTEIKDAAVDDLISFLNSEIKYVDVLGQGFTLIKTINVSESPSMVNISSDTANNKLVVTVTLKGSDFSQEIIDAGGSLLIQYLKVYDSTKGTNQEMFGVSYNSPLQLANVLDEIVINVNLSTTI